MASAKFARKAGYSQTAYSSNLQAAHWEAPYAYIESCKLLRSGGEGLRGLQELDNMLKLSSHQTDDAKVEDEGPHLEHKDAQKLRAKARSTSELH
jgi:serine/threonine-protein kinase ATR